MTWVTQLYLTSQLILYLSRLNTMDGILNKEQLAKVPSKTEEAKLKIMGGAYWGLKGGQYDSHTSFI